MDDDLIFTNKGAAFGSCGACAEVFRRGRIKVKLRKCMWGRKQVRYLGHLVGCGQVVVPEARCEAMRQYGKPLTKKGLKTFLGALGFYRKFVPGFAQFSSALTPATYLKAPHRVRWSADMEKAYRFLCECLCNPIVLTVPVVWCGHQWLFTCIQR